MTADPVHGPDGDAAGGTTSPPVPSGGAAEDFRRLHPLTPVVRGWTVLAAGLAIIANELRDLDLDLMVVLVGLAVLFVVAGLYGVLSYRFTRYRFEGDTLRVDTGVLFRRTRYVRLDRLQAVDVVRPLLARLLGLAELRLQVVGGSSAEAPLAYLSEEGAQTVRAELLARAAGIAPQTAEAPEHVLLTVPLGALLGSVALSGSTIVAVLGGVLLIVGAAFGRFEVLLFLVPGVIGTAMAMFNQFARHFEFTLAESPDGLRLRHGLLERRSQTVPPGRVQALRIVQPLLWRRLGWVRVEVNVAGYGRGDGGTEATSVLLPVAPRPVALAVIARVLPGVDVDAIPVEGVPRRARWARPVGWRALACGADDAVFVVQYGVWRRVSAVIPHGKIQSVRLTQGPWQRRLRLATVHVDSTPGPVEIHAAHRDADQAAAIVESQAARARLGRKAEAGRERWMAGG